MSCIFSDVSGHSVKSVSTAEEQVLPRPNSIGREEGGLAATPQNDKQGEVSIPRTEESVDEVLSIPKTQNDRLSFPNLEGTAMEEEEEDEEEGEEDVEEDEEEVEEDEEEEEDNDEEGNGEEGSQDEGDDGDEGEEEEKREDAEQEGKEEVQEHPPQEGGAPAGEVGFFFPLPLHSTSFYC